MTKNNIKLVIITGMSGAGKTVALQSFEDMGYFCVDNLPPSLLTSFWDLLQGSNTISKVCLVIDLRSRDFFTELNQVLTNMDHKDFMKLQIIFLEASDSKLVSRYKESRRSHPLQQDGTVLNGIQREREQLAAVKENSHLVIDTSSLSPRELRATLIREFHSGDDAIFTVEVMSFGFKYGIPIDSDIVMDVRFLPNPYYQTDLRPLTGQDAPVYDYVMAQSDTQTFFDKFTDMIDFTLPLYEAEGKSSVTIAIGCTGGQHRSVALTERIGDHIKALGYNVHVSHRDASKSQAAVKHS
ncbi:RNase adapter RapZ [Aerococcus sanguinicola]|uniref:RNase adapter RapZ n=1 Tax=unclassified Aerococcus TaxID=2618060 RepID=UPI0008A3C64A|nr:MULTISPECIES: RNase adapter RapZ [unclassified Aerococcus]MDK6233308.1 RNase adapter RapZ [Aerococcus sp. UMB10185]MDK6804936.1 RNase adapter RapZ [Aerococcus sp. UMB7834]MDK6855136.1 RNase adapter RapZ [Aerococcus sp. UMB7533]MDK8501948.1 RNase adapter RapZ [Aerococcus sp. UMB1112A]OFN04473.1 RNase adaptor protein RapZ [Aerococcus sp. HMSC062A02]